MGIILRRFSVLAANRVMKSNVHKIRKKQAFVFDERELLLLGIGAGVICMLIFVLGLMVGSSIQEKSVASPLQAEDGMNMGDDVSSTNASNSGEPALKTARSSKISEGEKTGNKDYKKSYYQVLPDSGTYVEVEATPVKGDSPQATSPKEQQPPQQNAEKPEPSAEVKPPVAAQQPAKPATAVATTQNVAVAPALPNVPKNPTDDMQVGRPPTKGVNERPLPAGTIYSVQIASSPNQEDAQRLQQKCGELGYEAFVMVANLADKGTWYRVRVGNLATKQEAELLKQELLKNAGQLAKSPIVIKVTE